jgi:GNAT superfamily N-acetyltransferase
MSSVLKVTLGKEHMTDIAIARLEQMPSDCLAELVAESEAGGFRFLRRLVEDWVAGRNKFDGPDEVFFAALHGSRIIGVCGLNADPYVAEPGVGRIRRLYVQADYRRSGVGRQLMQAVVTAARGRFRLLRVRTGDEMAARFYEALGFQAAVAGPDCSHVLELA